MSQTAPADLELDHVAEALAQYVRGGGQLSIADGSGVIGRLEAQLSDVLGLSNTLTFASGTAALHAAYLALDLPPGSEVIGAVNTFHASLTPAAHCRLNAVLVDVEPDTGTMSPAALEAAIGPMTRCVTVTHYLGHPAEMDKIAEICRARDLRLIEDFSHAVLSTWQGRPVGMFGDIAVGSLQARKTLVAGEGGILGTRLRSLYERAVLAGHYRGRALALEDEALRVFGETGLGLKMRMHPLAAVVALANAERLVERVAARTALLERFSRLLEPVPGVRPPVVRPGAGMGGWFSYRPQIQTLQLKRGADTDGYLRSLQAAGVPAHYPSIGSLQDMPMFTDPVPMRAAAGTWCPRLCGPFPGAAAFDAGRISVTVTPHDSPQTIDAYAATFADVSRDLAVRDAA
ncbi:aminotransferase class V-fold PLP-dependent enzyme [Streptomyces sp. NBC_01462]|uniref:aminotransferase class V-fold PLP-dependent enzyme n=1 Tax=Streptomyces sp. NBC_01462 TaxID=2903876 RepID=UPI002E367D49|nr:aminotransferase class V-fold PLP-dependent enzyme [Streptomyces sp. NBC_01462]